MKRITRSSLISAALCVLAAGPALAGDSGEMALPGAGMEHHGAMDGHGGAMPMHGRGQHLSEEQQDKLFAIMHAQEPQRRDYEKAARKAREALRELVESDKFDEAKASALAQAEGKAVAALALLRARTDAQVQALLTPEQRKQFPHDGPRREARPEPRS